ncbi:MAG: Y-family DNA polymerase [Muribaculaceae bacterium]|nr:Y-family DNA polymerase [Muribaculaceae bacterium]
MDCNNFFVSCERVFDPALRNRPVIVLSNNDGCAVAISNEAKAVGIKRGMPFFEIKDLVQRHNIAVLSGNHRLYGDLSSRVMATIAEIIPEIEIYSIDECFIRFDRWPVNDLNDCAREIVRKVRRNVGIPTSMGIAPTKTLAKIAAHFAKKYSAYRSVCLIDNDEKRRKALSLTDIEDVWGIGRRLGRKMRANGINTALQLADLPQDKVRRMVNIVGERTWRELNGQACIEFEDSPPDKMQICCSRSFADMIFEPEPLFEAMAAFASIASRKLRQQNSAAASITVFIHTNMHREDMDQYHASNYRALAEPTNDLMTLSAAAIDALRPIYRRGYGIKKAGILLSEIVPADAMQPSLFVDASDRERRKRLMSVMDSINAGNKSYDKVRVAACAPLESCVRCEHPSRRYTSSLSDIIIVNTPSKTTRLYG